MLRARIECCKNQAEVNVLINELCQIARHFKLVPNGIELGAHWQDLNTAAALLSYTGYWGSRDRGGHLPPISRDYKAAQLGCVTRKINQRGEFKVIYLIQGDPAHLRTLRWYYSGGMLWIFDARERERWLNELIEHYLAAKRKAEEMRLSIYGTSGIVGKN